MKKFLVALLVFATVVMAGVAFTIRFPRTTRSLRQKITRMIPQKAEPAVETPSEQNTKVIVPAEDVQVTVSQILDEPTETTSPAPTHIMQTMPSDPEAQLIDNVQDYEVISNQRIPKQAVVNQSPINVQGGVEFSDGFLMNSDRAREGLTFSSDGKIGDWHFGDGTTGLGSVVQHAYGESGIYNVTFLAEESGTIYLTQTKLIVGGVIPKFATENSTPRVNEMVSLDGKASKSLVGSITKYEWSCAELQSPQCVFGSSTGQQTSVQFAEPGIYEVSLAATNNIGVRETISQSFSVSGEKPVAKIVSIKPSLRDRHPAEYVFDARRSVNILGQSNDLLYEWDINGDAVWDKTTTQPTMMHEYSESGAKTVKLRVQHEHGRDTYFSEMVTQVIPSVNILWVDFEVPFVLTEQEPFVLRADTIPDVEYEWEILPKGTVDILGNLDAGAVNVVFQEAGTYTVQLMVKKGEATKSLEKTIVVRGKESPLAVIQQSSDEGETWHTNRSTISFLRNENGMTDVRLRAHSVDERGEIGCDMATLSYSWSVDGAPVSTACNPGEALNMYFKEADVYVVELTVYQPGNQNRNDITSFLVEIKNKNPEFVQSIFYETNQNTDVLEAGPLNFLVTAGAEDPDTKNPIQQYFFEPLENGVVLPDTQLLSTGQAYFNLAQYEGPHALSFRVTATDSDGGVQVSEGTGTYRFENVIEENEPPVISDFIVSKTGIKTGESVRFDLRASDREETVLIYKWIVSEGAVAILTEQTTDSFFLTFFEKEGTYTVRAEVSDGMSTALTERSQTIYVRE